MNYEDEEYVRFYTRDTVGWKVLGWEGQTVLALMLRGKFDRSGVFDCAGESPSQAVTMVTGIPAEVVEVGLARLFERSTWILRDGLIVWPKFVHAQTCGRSDRLRQRESRENRRLTAMGADAPPVAAVTTCHGESQVSQPVTSEQSRAEQKQSLDPPPTPAAKPKARRWRRFPEDFVPDSTHRQIANNLRLDIDEQLRLIRDHEFKDPKSDAGAVFRSWLRNAPKFGTAPGGKPAPPQAQAPRYRVFKPRDDSQVTTPTQTQLEVSKALQAIGGRRV